MNLELIGQGVLAILLLLTIGYCAVLERRLRSIRSAHQEMQGLLEQFGTATLQAQRGIGSLREAAQDISAELQGDIDTARELRDELRLITQTGNTLADKIERGLVRRDRAPAMPTAPEREREDRGQLEDEPVSESERELMKALRQVS